MLQQEIIQKLASNPSIQNHPRWRDLLAVASCETHISTAGYPYLCESGFQRMIDRVPHLFSNGAQVLAWTENMKAAAESIAMPKEAATSLARALKVIGTVVRTAAITAPSDLWILRQVLGIHRELGILDRLLKEGELKPETLDEGSDLYIRQLKIDLHFLVSRGYLDVYGDAFVPSADPFAFEIFTKAEPLNPHLKTDLVSEWMAWFEGQDRSESLMAAMVAALPPEAERRPSKAWMATHADIEIGYRLVPIVLALRGMERTGELKAGVEWDEKVPRNHPYLVELMTRAGILDAGKITQLGARVFSRGPGPFGIIGAYYPYLNQLDALLVGKLNRSWVNRGKNVAASQDANRKTFQMANNALNQFCEETGFRYGVFIEHAVGRGEATRQRLAMSGENDIQYFGADLEDAAIEQAIAEQKRGNLPENMRFIRSADIGDPHKIIDSLQAAGLPTEGAVMMVGNGFHEVRNQTNQIMLEVLRGYQQAGILLIFTEETGLSDGDLLATAWNTYHAGFRYVHEMSGQGLRPAWDSKRRKVWSWRRCARRAGYTVLDRYTVATRTIFPTRKPHRKNPSISVTYFCVPESVMSQVEVPGRN